MKRHTISKEDFKKYISGTVIASGPATDGKNKQLYLMVSPLEGKTWYTFRYNDQGTTVEDFNSAMDYYNEV